MRKEVIVNRHNIDPKSMSAQNFPPDVVQFFTYYKVKLPNAKIQNHHADFVQDAIERIDELMKIGSHGESVDKALAFVRGVWVEKMPPKKPSRWDIKPKVVAEVSEEEKHRLAIACRVENFIKDYNPRFPRHWKELPVDARRAPGVVVLTVEDDNGRDALVACSQDGIFWPMPVEVESTAGNYARNRWAAKTLANLFWQEPAKSSEEVNNE